MPPRTRELVVLVCSLSALFMLLCSISRVNPVFSNMRGRTSNRDSQKKRRGRGQNYRNGSGTAWSVSVLVKTEGAKKAELLTPSQTVRLRTFLRCGVVLQYNCAVL